MSDLMFRDLFIRKSNGSCYRITIPSTATITYGNLHPGSKGGYSNSIGANDDKYVLRIYEGVGANKRQTAVFRGIEEFRDLSYGIQEVDNPELMNNPNAQFNIGQVILSSPVAESPEEAPEWFGDFVEEQAPAENVDF